MAYRLIPLVLTLLAVLASGAPATAGPDACDNRVNNTFKKLLECVSLDGVRQHQAAFQAIADANGGVRVSGTPGYDASVDYVVGLLENAGYDVTVQPFNYLAFIREGPSTLEQLAPVAVVYDEFVDYRIADQTDPGNVTAVVTAVDLQLGLGNTSTSGCEAVDFAGFPVGNIALIQRGTCTFQSKAENAAAAGAVGVIIFNQGNTAERTVLFSGTLTAAYACGIPVMFVPLPPGRGWAGTPGLQIHMNADTFRGQATTYNVLAEPPEGGRTTS
jgi:Zn-dependent M28 family amino/carboxypeptidase